MDVDAVAEEDVVDIVPFDAGHEMEPVVGEEAGKIVAEGSGGHVAELFDGDVPRLAFLAEQDVDGAQGFYGFSGEPFADGDALAESDCWHAVPD